MNKIKMKSQSLAIICCAILGTMFSAPLLAQQAQQPLKLKAQVANVMPATAATQTKPPLQSAASPQVAQGVLTLDQVVNLALAHSPDLALARVRFNVAQNVAGVDRSEFRPNVFTGSGAAYTNGFPQTPGGAPPSVFEVSYTQALLDPIKRGALHADEDRAKNQGSNTRICAIP